MHLPRLAPLALILLRGALPALAEDWPQWRGGDQDASTTGTVLAGAPALDLEVAWRRPLGSGYSSISVAGGLGVTMATIGTSDWVVAFEAASGAERWRHDLGAAFLGRSGSDDGPMSTPAIAGDRVLVLTPDGRFLALDARSGERRWERSLPGEFGSAPDYYGYSTAPIVAGGRVYLLAGGREGAMLVALDRATGEPVWRAGSDAIGHQNLVVTTLGGVEQVVAPAESSVSGFATDDGRLLWRHEFEEGAPSGGAVAIDAERVLVTRWETTHLLAVEPAAEPGAATPQQAREIWGDDRLGSSYAVPLRRGDHLYGFDRRFLTCVELATGELVWRSRPPGGQGLIAVDDHLVVVADDGALVAVEATPEGYRETGRLGLFERRRVLTPTSYAGGRLFVRDLEEMVAVDVARAAAPVRRAERPAIGGEGTLATLLGRIASASGAERAAALEALGRDDSTMPVVEGGTVHFLYQGEEPDLVIVGDMSGAHANLPLHRLPGTDWFHRSFPAPGSGRWEYRFSVFDEARLDPRNPAVVETPEGERSVVAFGGDDGSLSPQACPGCPRGEVAAHEIASKVPERSYKLSVYTPPGYANETRVYPTVFWAEGEQAQQYGEVVAWLDALIGRGEIEPVVGVFLELPGAAWFEQSRGRQLDPLVGADGADPAAVLRGRIARSLRRAPGGSPDALPRLRRCSGRQSATLPVRLRLT